MTLAVPNQVVYFLVVPPKCFVLSLPVPFMMVIKGIKHKTESFGNLFERLFWIARPYFFASQYCLALSDLKEFALKKPRQKSRI